MAGRRAQDSVRAAVVRAAARSGDIDRYLAALLAPRAARPGLIALTAFLGEVARIPALVNEPMMGEMRLQWWRDAIGAEPAGGSSGSPIADALREAIERHRLPEHLFDALLATRSRDLVPHPFNEAQGVDGYLDATEGNAFRLAARIIDPGASREADGLLRAAGQAWGRVRLLQGLPLAVAKGRALPPAEASSGPGAADWVAAARPLIAGARAWVAETRNVAASNRSINLAILPVALVEPYLAALQRLGPDIARARAEISPLTRVFRLWWASALGRV
jgi:phytoene synthase